jgi:hypothetical protein
VTIVQTEEAIADLDRAIELALPVEDKPKGPSRKEVVASWSAPRELTDDERDLFASLPDVFGSASFPEEPRGLTREEQDGLLQELLAVRSAQDILEGRHAAIRGAVFSAMTQDAIEVGVADPEHASWEYISPDLGKKLVRQRTGGKASLDADKLKAILPNELFHRIFAHVVTETTTTRSRWHEGEWVVDSTSSGREEEWDMDEEELLACLRSGELSLEDLSEAVVVSKVGASFYVRDA